MSDSEDAFESADEGAEEKKENEEKQNIVTPPAKATAKETLPQATGGEGNVRKGKTGKGKRRKGKGGRAREHSEPSDHSDKEPGAKVEPVTDEKQSDSSKKNEKGSKNNVDEPGEQKVVSEEGLRDNAKEKSAVEEIKKQENDSIVDRMADLNIERDVPENKPEKEDEQVEEVKPKRDVTPTRKIERRNKPESEASDVLDRLSGAAEKQKESGGGWGWGSWGSSILSTATKSVSTFTSQVGEGFNTVLETVESSLGAPNPEEVAKQQRAVHTAKEPSENGAPDSNPASDEEEEGAVGGQGNQKKEVGNEKDEANDRKEDESAGWFSSWGIPSGITKVVENTTKVVENTSKNLVVGGLDVLETIGKKTYDVLAEGDHGLKNTIKNSGLKPNLSQMLREAKEEAEEQAKQNEEFEEAGKAHFGALFDDFSGLAHLEGLEMVSNQCEGKVQSLLASMPSEDVDEIKPDLVSIKEEFDLEQHEDDEAEDEMKEHEFKQLVTEHIGNLGLNVTPDKLIEVQGRGRHWLDDTAEEQGKGVRVNAKEIHQMGIQSLAELTACSMESFHKVAQLLQVNQSAPLNSYKFRASNLKILTLVLGTEVDILASKFTECLNTAADDSEEPDSVNPLITNIYLEASNSKTYIQDAFQLLLPVLQHAALRSHANS